MGYILNAGGFDQVIGELRDRFRLFAPVLKEGEGRFTDTDVVRYCFVETGHEIEFKKRSDYSFKEVLIPLSQTLFYFTENEVKAADEDEKDILVFLRSCDLHAVKRLDDIYLRNGAEEDWFYKRIRKKLHFVLMGCSESFDNCFCVSMNSNRVDEGYDFSVNAEDGLFGIEVKNEEFLPCIEKNAERKGAAAPAYVTENEVKVTVPGRISNDIYKNKLWDEYTVRCINCGRCNFVCPTCTCFTMQDLFYTENGRVGERRRVCASCMVDGYSTVAGGGQYRKTNGERMRFKTLHKIGDFRKRFGYDMCVGCGRCDSVCPEYISFANIINKVNDAEKEGR